jgi:hypothetical protein
MEKQSKKNKKKEKDEDNGDMNVFIDKVNLVENQLAKLKKDVVQIKKTQSNLYCSPFVTKIFKLTLSFQHSHLHNNKLFTITSKSNLLSVFM